METYISRLRNPPAQYIVTRSIMDIFLEVDQRKVSRVPKRCWEQEVLDFAGLKEAGEGGGCRRRYREVW